MLDEEFQKWRDCPLDGTLCLMLDARYEKVRHGGQIVSCTMLVAIGIDPQGRRSVLGTSVSMSKADAHWREFLASLQGRRRHGVKLVIGDAHAGLKEALDARLMSVPWQRCQSRLMKNALAYIPRPSMRAEVIDDGAGLTRLPSP